MYVHATAIVHVAHNTCVYNLYCTLQYSTHYNTIIQKLTCADYSLSLWRISLYFTGSSYVEVFQPLPLRQTTVDPIGQFHTPLK